MRDKHIERGYSAIGLSNPKSGVNVGSVMRAAGCYGASLVVCSGERVKNFYHRMPTDTQAQWRRTPILTVADLRSSIPYSCVPIAVDLLDGAKSLVEFKHPDRAFYIFGPEDGTLGKRITEWCAHTIYVPTSYCMNLAATVNVVLYDRMAKRSAERMGR